MNTYANVISQPNIDNQLSMLLKLAETTHESHSTTNTLELFFAENKEQLSDSINKMLSNAALFDKRVTSAFTDLWSSSYTEQLLIDPRFLTTVNEVVADFLSGFLSAIANNRD